jgi:hypothetical protein
MNARLKLMEADEAQGRPVERIPPWRDPALPVDHSKISAAIERIFNDAPRLGTRLVVATFSTP